MITYYKHTQIGYITIILFSLLILMTITFIVSIGLNALTIGLFLVFGFCLALYSTMTITVDNTHLSVCFGFGLYKKQWPLSEIQFYNGVRLPWFMGWGIVWTFWGWLYNISGIYGVRIELKSGKRYLLGTHSSDEVINAIYKALHS